MATVWKAFLALAGIALVLYLLGGLAVMGIFVVPAVLGSFDAWEGSQQVYLRNRTGAPLQVTLTVPRTQLGVDTVWWGITTNGTAVVRAAVVRELYVPGLRRHLVPPALFGAADTLVAAGFEHMVYYPGKYRTFHWYQNPDSDLWMDRAKQSYPALSPTLQALPLFSEPDSVRLVFSLAPDSVLQAASLDMGFRHSDPDERWISPDGPKLLVSWRDRAGQVQQRPFPTGRWLDTMQQVADQRGEHTYQLTHYADYQ